MLLRSFFFSVLFLRMPSNDRHWSLTKKNKIKKEHSVIYVDGESEIWSCLRARAAKIPHNTSQGALIKLENTIRLSCKPDSMLHQHRGTLGIEACPKTYFFLGFFTRFAEQDNKLMRVIHKSCIMPGKF